MKRGIDKEQRIMEQKWKCRATGANKRVMDGVKMFLIYGQICHFTMDGRAGRRYGSAERSNQL